MPEKDPFSPLVLRKQVCKSEAIDFSFLLPHFIPVHPLVLDTASLLITIFSDSRLSNQSFIINIHSIKYCTLRI